MTHSLSDAVGVWMNAPGDRMYVGRPGGEIWTVDPTTGRRIEPTMQTDGGDPVLISTSPDGSRVLVTSWNMEYTPRFDPLRCGDRRADPGRLVGIGLTALTARGEIAGAVRYQSVVRYDADTFERIGALPGASGGLDTVNVSADGRILSTYSLDNTVTVYDLVGGMQLGGPIPVSGEWNYPLEGAYSGVLRADGAELAVNVPAGIALWDLRPSSHAARAMAGATSRDEWIAYLATWSVSVDVRLRRGLTSGRTRIGSASAAELAQPVLVLRDLPPGEEVPKVRIDARDGPSFPHSPTGRRHRDEEPTGGSSRVRAKGFASGRGSTADAEASAPSTTSPLVHPARPTAITPAVAAAVQRMAIDAMFMVPMVDPPVCARYPAD